MKNLINIEIKNSFNKEEDSQKSVVDAFNNDSTLNDNKNISEVYSMSIGSITANSLQDNFKIINNKKDKAGFWREVLICAIGGAVGTILGALSMYFIFGIR